jgi:circadian clock protein KaiC
MALSPTAVARRGVKRLFVDGLAAYYEVGAEPERITSFFAALANEFRARGVTTLYTSGTPEVLRSEVTAPPTGIATILDNLIVLRFVEFRAELHRLLSIVKVGESDFDPKLREFQITSSGIRLSAGFESAEALLSGFARERVVTALGSGNGPPGAR